MLLRRKQIVIFFTIMIVILIGSIWLFASRVFCYDTNVAHPNIVRLATELYNQKFPNAVLTDGEIACIEQGAREEDTPTRWLNHFYDPINNQGLWFGTEHLSAKDWAQSPKAQTGFALGDQSWQRALSDYAKGDKDKAFIELGHVLHLLADMAVPAHTRNDIHIVGDSYEQFVKNNWNIVRNQIALASLSLDSNCPSLNQCFDELAKYSNGYFLSDDTVVSSDYKNPKLDSSKIQYLQVGKNIYKFLLNDEGTKMCKDISGEDWKTVFSEEKQIMNCIVDDQYVKIEYATHLLPKSISASASVIKLFLDETKKENKQEVPVLRLGLRGLGDALLGKVVSVAENVYDYLKGKSGMSTTAQAGDVVLGSQNNNVSADNTVKNETNIKTNIESASSAGRQILNPSSRAELTTGQANISDIESEKPASSAGRLESSEIIDQQSPIINYQLPVTKPVAVPVVYYGGGSSGSVPTPPNPPPASPVGGQGGSTETTTSTTTSTDNNNQTADNTTTTTQTTTTTSSTPLEGGTGGVGDQTPTTSVADPEVATGQASTTSTSSTTSDSDTTSTPPPDTTPPIPPEYLQTYPESIFTDNSTTSLNLQISTDTVKVYIYNSSSTNTNLTQDIVGEVPIIASSANLNLSLELTEGHNYFYFTAEDEAGNISVPAPIIHYILDTGAPPVPVLNITEEQGNSATSTIINLDITGTDALSQTTYDIQYRVSPTSTWQDYATNTPNIHYTFTGTRGQTYYFQVRARDAFNHTSEWGNTINYHALYSQTVVINEVAWMGTGANPMCQNDEWLELYNNTPSDINLSNWKILVSGVPMSWTKTSSTIKAHSYYLLERTDNHAIEDISADGIFTGALNNNGEKLTLVDDNNNIIDEVDASIGWFKGNTVTYSSMERIDAQKNGSDSDNWQTSLGSRPLGISYLGSPINGSPRQPNFGFLVLRDTQAEAIKILDKANNPWVLTDYTVPVGKILKLEPGVVVKSKYGAANLKVYGGLEINGTAEEPVTITSGRDNNLGSELLNTTVGTWISTTPAPGDIQGLVLYSTSTANINYLQLKYAGYSFKPNNFIYTPFVRQAIRAINADLTLTNSIIANTTGTVIYAEGGRIQLQGDIFDGGTLALETQEVDLSMSDCSVNNFSDSRGPMVLQGVWPELYRLVFNNNFLDRIYFNSITIATGIKNLSRELSQMSYFNYLGVSASATLQIEPGVEMNFSQYGSLEVKGALQSLGTADLPIIFKPFVVGKNWGQIIFSNASGQLSYTHLENGNLRVNGKANNDGMIYANNASLNLDNVYVQNSRRPGSSIQTDNSALNISNIQITDDVKETNSYGVVARGGSLNIAGGWFSHLAYGIIADSLVNLQIGSSMSSSSFDLVDNFISWPGWTGFGSSTTSSTGG